MKRLTGQTPYTGKLVMNAAKRVDVSVASDLRGMALNFPAPFGKTADASLPLQAEWTAAQDAGPDNRRWLTVTAGENINMLFERHMGQQGGADLAGHGDGESRFIESAAVTAKLQATLHLFDLIVGTEEEFHIAGGTTDTIAALRAVRAVSAATLADSKPSSAHKVRIADPLTAASDSPSAGKGVSATGSLRPKAMGIRTMTVTSGISLMSRVAS